MVLGGNKFSHSVNTTRTNQKDTATQLNRIKWRYSLFIQLKRAPEYFAGMNQVDPYSDPDAEFGCYHPYFSEFYIDAAGEWVTGEGVLARPEEVEQSTPRVVFLRHR